ncbi:MAG: nucleosidase [Chryseobacterium sp.]|jgi:adenosylhomocysteine nucleosidase|uniref:5'-methylthioadenosine/S-adenosylhomocysteine nucleosidase family protein n=1 Tax=Chryseobacterium sp. TaxID=1871047 RepID=UPI00262B620D|nr:nucleosidase [Chryseobacterium sp.]MDF2552590.1 nucleosidase [Chryseobacterium sp.]MDF2932855.1 nucleosidase [Chryseobacterium sp.]
MIKINNEISFSIQDTLFVFALGSEAGKVFDHINKLITGIGKVNAAIELTKAIQKNKPKLIINLGSAGGIGFHKGEIICCTQFIQRDMDARGLGFKKFETPLSDIPIILENGLKMDSLKEGICGSGDSFETNHINTEYNVIDMEAYPLALIARQENIPFLCLKYISDDAGSDAADDWSVQVHLASEAFRKILFNDEI